MHEEGPGRMPRPCEKALRYVVSRSPRQSWERLPPLLVGAVQLANRIGANLPDRVLHGRGLLNLPVLALVAGADERASDQDLIALVKRCRNELAQAVPGDYANATSFSRPTRRPRSSMTAAWRRKGR